MYANEERNEARLVLVTVGYIDGSKEIQTALYDKMEGMEKIKDHVIYAGSMAED